MKLFMVLQSRVAGHVGECRPTWLNYNEVCHRTDQGISGFFKPVKRILGIPFRHGQEFHGLIRDGIVTSTSKEVKE